jgi:hypothetical protein
LALPLSEWLGLADDKMKKRMNFCALHKLNVTLFEYHHCEPAAATAAGTWTARSAEAWIC